MPLPLAIFGLPGGSEWIVILILGLLIFGKRLPEVGKSLGKSIVEFKKGLKGVQDEIDRASDDEPADMLPPPEPKRDADPTGSAQPGESTSTPQKEKETVSR